MNLITKTFEEQIVYNSIRAVPLFKFERPYLQEDLRSFIAVDVNFETKGKDRGIFIDHHLTEQDGVDFSSNTRLIIENYDYIKDELKKSFLHNEYNDTVLTIYYHCDIDGLMSAMLVKNILEGKKFKPTMSSLVGIFGELGDISDSTDSLIEKYFSEICNSTPGICNSISPDSFIKKIKLISSKMARVLKVFRSFERTHKLININVYDFEDCLTDWINDTDCSDFGIMYLVNNLVSNEQSQLMIEFMDIERNRLANQYLDPGKVSSPIFESTCIYKKEMFKLLIIDSPIDVGRSLLWTIRGKLRYWNKPKDKYNYSISDMKGFINISSFENFAIYNTTLRKLSIDSEKSDLAYNLAKELNGGGHITEEGSIGSCEIDFKILNDKLKAIDIF